MSKLRVNRYLKDKSMDCIDHALGRPLDPMAPTYRDYFNVDRDSDWGREWLSSPHWELVGSNGDNHSINFRVTDAGRRALSDHLKSISDPHRLFNIEFDGFRIPVVSTTRSKARYSYWRDVCDALPDLTFRDFCKRARVSPASTPSHGRPAPSRDRAEPPARQVPQPVAPGMGGQR